MPRADKIRPAGSANDINLRYSIHTDAPVTPIDPMRLMASAVERTSLSGRVVGHTERISRLQALRAVTIDAAWQMFQEDTRGSIEVGKFADVVVLSDNPLNDAVALIDIDVLMTVVGGKTIYRHDR